MKNFKGLPIFLIFLLFFLIAQNVSGSLIGYDNPWPNGQKELPTSKVILRITPHNENSTLINVTFFSNSTTGTTKTLCANISVLNNTVVSCNWSGLNRSTTYRWFADVSVGRVTNRTPNYEFTTFTLVGGIFLNLEENITSLGELGAFMVGLVGIGITIIIYILQKLPEIAIYVFIASFIIAILYMIKQVFGYLSGFFKNLGKTGKKVGL